MLTKDLIRYRLYKGDIKPQFIKTEKSELINFAAQLLSLYKPEDSVTRGELLEAAAPLINSFKDLKLSRGLNKLVQDRCEFSHVSDIDYAEVRQEIFANSAEILKKQDFNDYNDFNKAVANKVSYDREIIDKGIYADLPENEKLIKFRPVFPGELLQRYNVALVQSLLLYSDKINIEAEDPEPAKLRNLFKYLKFFRLLADLSKKTDNEGNLLSSLRIQVNGPVSLFEQTRKYGLQLASFFPAVCSLKKWKLHTQIKLRDKNLTLKLDQSSKLVSHYRNFNDYVPEEIVLFKNLFNEKNKNWKIAENSDFIDAGNNELIFPDFTLRHGSGKTFFLELFHGWHSYQLLSRLKLAENNKGMPLLIGVDRFLSNKPEIKELIESSSWFQDNGFQFRDYPGVEAVSRLLKKKIAENGDLQTNNELQKKFDFGKPE